jgi:hypothetical protein
MKNGTVVIITDDYEDNGIIISANTYGVVEESLLDEYEIRLLDSGDMIWISENYVKEVDFER